MIIPINHVAYINIRVQRNKPRISSVLIIVGILVMIFGAIDSDKSGIVGICLIVLGLLLLWLMQETEYLVVVGTSATTHNFRCTKDTFMVLYKGMQEALNNRIF